MTRREFLHRAGASIAAVAPGVQAARKPPNIIFLFADDMRYDCTGITSNGKYKTPNLDQLGNDGVIFDRAYNTTTICKASRANVLTGMYEFANGCNFSHGSLIHENFMKSYPILLRKNGYYTGFAGKLGFEVPAADDPKGKNKEWKENPTPIVEKEFDWWCGWSKANQGSYKMIENTEATEWVKKYPERKPDTHTTRLRSCFLKGIFRSARVEYLGYP